MSGATSAIAIGSAVAGLASAGIGAYGAIQSGEAQSKAAAYNAQVAQQNQQIANNNATAAAQAGEAQAAASSQKTRAQVGGIKAAEAASGVDVNTGSAVDVRSSAASLGELDAITIRSNAARTAYGYQTQAAGYSDSATLDKAQSADASTAGEIGGASTLIGGAAAAGKGYSDFLKQSGGSAMTAPGGDDEGTVSV